MKHAFPLIGLWLSLLGVVPAVAAVNSSAAAKVTIKLVDLDPNDGVTPSLSFGGGVRWGIHDYLFDGAISSDGVFV